MLYQPLTKAQEEKYRRFKAEKEKPAKIKDEAEVTDVYKRQVWLPVMSVSCSLLRSSPYMDISTPAFASTAFILSVSVTMTSYPSSFACLLYTSRCV